MSIEDISHNSLFTRTVKVFPKEIYSKSVDTAVMDALNSYYDGKFLSDGYVIPGSMEIIRRSMGRLSSQDFQGYFSFTVDFRAKIVRPTQGDRFRCIVSGVNPFGIMCDMKPMRILLPLEYNKDTDAFKNIHVGDSIEIEVMNVRIDMENQRIMVFAILAPKITARRGAKAAASAAAAPLGRPSRKLVEESEKNADEPDVDSDDGEDVDDEDADEADEAEADGEVEADAEVEADVPKVEAEVEGAEVEAEEEVEEEEEEDEDEGEGDYED